MATCCRNAIEAMQGRERQDRNRKAPEAAKNRKRPHTSEGTEDSDDCVVVAAGKQCHDSDSDYEPSPTEAPKAAAAGSMVTRVTTGKLKFFSAQVIERAFHERATMCTFHLL